MFGGWNPHRRIFFWGSKYNVTGEFKSRKEFSYADNENHVASVDAFSKHDPYCWWQSHPSAQNFHLSQLQLDIPSAQGRRSCFISILGRDPEKAWHPSAPSSRFKNCANLVQRCVCLYKVTIRTIYSPPTKCAICVYRHNTMCGADHLFAAILLLVTQAFLLRRALFVEKDTSSHQLFFMSSKCSN